jgi:Intracellular proteinase inhibitor
MCRLRPYRPVETGWARPGVGGPYNRHMRRVAILVLLTTLAGCGGDGGASESQSGKQQKGLSLSVSFDEPLHSGQAVTWTLEVENAGAEETTLVFRSGKDGDVALLQGGREAYRWSSTRYFTQAMRQVRLEPGERKEFELEDKGFSPEAGDYELVAELDSEPAPPTARRSVTVRGRS